MRHLFVIFALTAFALVASVSAYGQTAEAASAAGTDPSITQNRVFGEVTAIDRSAAQVTVRTEAGSVVNVMLGEKTIYMRVPPGEETLEKAVPVTLVDVDVGDSVLARGTVTGDRKSVLARMLVVMTKADITLKRERERAEWSKRGIAGVISTLNPETKEITLSRPREGGVPVIIPAEATVRFRRYAPDSVRFSDAKPSSFAELKMGDQLRALGNRSADGKRFVAEEIVSGSFRLVGGPVTAVNAAAGEIKINDIQTRQTITVALSKHSMLRRIPPEVATAFAQRGQEGARTSRTGGDVDFQETLERLPALAPAELKPGEMVLVSSVSGDDASRVTAIALLTGFDAFLNSLQRQTRRTGDDGPQVNLGLPDDVLDVSIKLADLSIGLP